MNRSLSAVLIACVLLAGSLQCVGISAEETLKDGMYRVLRVSQARDSLSPLANNEILVDYNPLFQQEGEAKEYMVLARTPFVPMTLKEKPARMQDPTGRTASWLLLSLTDDVAARLEEFTRANIGSRAAVVIRGEAVSVHKIREVVKDGKLHVSCCSGNGIDYLFVELQDNVREPGNSVLRYLEGAELQYDGDGQKANIIAGLEDILALSSGELEKKRYGDYQGNKDRWDLPTLLTRHFVPAAKGSTLGDGFYRDVKAPEVQAEVRKILEKLGK